MPFHPAAYQSFRFVAWDFDPATASARFDYALDDAHHFREIFHFPDARLPLEPARLTALESILPLLHWLAGVSYYKTAIPPTLEIESTKPSPATARFLEQVYRHGLGEFFYRNQLSPPERIAFPANHAPSQPPAWRPPPGVVVPMGGGKDSLVALDWIRRASESPPRLFSLGNPPAIAAVSERVSLPRIVVRRELDRKLLALNEAGAYNGHVPISAIIAAVLAVAAVLHEFDCAVLANERSADSGNVELEGMSVNHQYSKSLAFEQAIQARFAECLPGFDYFSLLRPLSELDIARRFAGLREYHEVFTSCNANFRLLRDKPTQRWCLDCPKCRFVFLAMAPFSDREHLIQTFGGNPLADPAQLPGYFALVGFDAHKPFECVGEIEESLAAFHQLAAHPAWRDDFVTRQVREQVLPRHQENLSTWWRQALTPAARHAYPPARADRLWRGLNETTATR